jgi:hypothetical protein
MLKAKNEKFRNELFEVIHFNYEKTKEITATLFCL